MFASADTQQIVGRGSGRHSLPPWTATPSTTGTEAGATCAGLALRWMRSTLII